MHNTCALHTTHSTHTHTHAQTHITIIFCAIRFGYFGFDLRELNDDDDSDGSWLRLDKQQLLYGPLLRLCALTFGRTRFFFLMRYIHIIVQIHRKIGCGSPNFFLLIHSSSRINQRIFLNGSLVRLLYNVWSLK